MSKPYNTSKHFEAPQIRPAKTADDVVGAFNKHLNWSIQLAHKISQELAAIKTSGGQGTTFISTSVGGGGGGISTSLTVQSLDLSTIITSTDEITFDTADGYVVTQTGAGKARLNFTGQDLTKVDDTNVTLTLGGTPVASLLKAVSLTLGWTGVLAEARGGTNQSAYALGDILYSSATNVLSRLAGNITATRKFLQQTGTGAVSAAPVWDTILAADIPASALTKIDDTNVTLTLGGSPTVALLAATSLTLGWTGTLAAARLNANVVQAVTNDTNVTGSIAAQILTLGWAGVLAEARGGTNQSTYTLGDLLYASAANTLSKLAGNITTTKKFLTQTGNGSISAVPVWDTIVDGDVPDILTITKISNLTTNGFVKTSSADGTLTIDTNTYLTSVTAHNVLSATHGDTLADTVVRGDLIVGNSTPKWARLAIGTSGKFLKTNGTDPAWTSIVVSDIGSGANLSVGNSIQITAGSGTAALLVAATIDTIQDIRTTATPQFAKMGLGQAADVNDVLTIKGSGFNVFRAVNSAGTKSVTIDDSVVTLNAGYLLDLLGPNTGVQTFSFEQPDGIVYLKTVANLTTSQTVTFAELTGTVALLDAGQTFTSAIWNGTKISEAYGGTNQSTYTLGDILYSSAANTLSKLAGNTTTTKKYLSQTGNGTISAAPAWSQISVSTEVTGVLPVLNGGTGQFSYTNGQLLIGNTTGNTLVAATLTGTASQVTVTNGAGSITLSLPQSIATSSTPQFAQLGLGIAAQSGSVLYLSNTGTHTGHEMEIVAGSAPAYAQLRISNNSLAGVFAVLCYVADNTQLGFDVDWNNNTWKARNAAVGWLRKSAAIFAFDGSTGNTIGNAATQTQLFAIDLANGNVYGKSGTTGMTAGFIHIPSAAGAPTGAPTNPSGRVPMYYDTTNNNFYVYNGAWKKVGLA